jgi:hypothetical protein
MVLSIIGQGGNHRCKLLAIGYSKRTCPTPNRKRPWADQPAWNKIPCSSAQPNPTYKVEDSFSQDATILGKISPPAAGKKVQV